MILIESFKKENQLIFHMGNKKEKTQIKNFKITYLLCVSGYIVEKVYWNNMSNIANKT